MSEKIRDEFEEWFSEYSLLCGGDWFERDSRGDYYYPSTHDAWMGWKASRAALVVELPEKAALMSASSVYHALDEAGVSYK